MKQKDLAKITETASRTILDIENDNRYPAYEVLSRTIHALNISADHFFWPDKPEYRPGQERFIREFLSCDEWEQKVITNKAWTLMRSLRDKPKQNIIDAQSYLYKGDALMYNRKQEGLIVPTDKPKFCITVDDALMKEIDDFRFHNRYNSRSQATLDLIRIGLEALKAKEEAQEGKTSQKPGVTK